MARHEHELLKKQNPSRSSLVSLLFQKQLHFLTHALYLLCSLPVPSSLSLTLQVFMGQKVVTCASCWKRRIGSVQRHEAAEEGVGGEAV